MKALSKKHDISFNQSLSEAAHKYDGFIIDLWGVVHDGVHLYDGALACLQNLKDAGKKIIFLTNAPRRKNAVAELLHDMGISKNLYDHIMSSGQATYQYLSDNPPYPNGSKCLIIGSQVGASLLVDTGYVIANSVDDADFILVLGYNDDYAPVDKYQDVMTAAYEKKLPMICANPDKFVVRHSGLRIPCAGLIAEQYEELGGDVVSFGKPLAGVYDYCFDLFTTMGLADKNKIAAIGDNIETDILGGINNGVDSFLVTGGILAEYIAKGDENDIIYKYCDKHNIYPTNVMKYFKW
jgi:HAD superfamily hydrolase (TIGR01459 family)